MHSIGVIGILNPPPTPVFVEIAIVVVVFLYEKFTKCVQRLCTMLPYLTLNFWQITSI